MFKSKRTVDETIKYFEQLSYGYEVQAHRTEDKLNKSWLAGKAEAYGVAAFELKRNMERPA